MVSCGDADAMVTGNTRRYSSSLEKVSKVVELQTWRNNIWFKLGS